MSWLLDNITRRRRYRQSVSAYAALLDTPAVTTTELPAPARFGLKATAPVTTGAALTAAGRASRSIHVPAMAAGDVHVIGVLEQGVDVTLTKANVQLCLDMGNGSYQPVLVGA